MREERDPVEIQGRRLDTGRREAIEAEVDAVVKAAFEQALADPLPQLGVS